MRNGTRVAVVLQSAIDGHKTNIFCVDKIVQYNK